MGDNSIPRTSPAELDDDAVLAANRTWPKRPIVDEPQLSDRPMSALQELEDAQDEQSDANPGYEEQKRVKTGGRQKGTPNKVARVDIQKSARVFGLRALATLVDVMEDERANNSDRISAAKEILDRGFGKTKQVTEITGADGGDIQTKLTIEFVGQPPINAVVQAQIKDESEKIIDMQLNTVRVPENRRPWDPK